MIDNTPECVARDIARRDRPERVVLLVDNSGSMTEHMPASLKTRQHAAFEATLAITNASDPSVTAYALVSFESSTRLVAAMDTDYLLLQMEAGLVSAGGTAMNLGISVALQQDGDRVILLSDGQPTCTREELWAVVETAVSLGVRIDTISIGGADDEIMREIARRTGGVWQKPVSAEQLIQSFMKLETRARLMLTHEEGAS